MTTDDTDRGEKNDFAFIKGDTRSPVGEQPPDNFELLGAFCAGLRPAAPYRFIDVHLHGYLIETLSALLPARVGTVCSGVDSGVRVEQSFSAAVNTP